MQNTNKKIKLDLLKPEEVTQAANLMKKVLLENPYYNKESKKEYMIWYSAEQIMRHMKKGDVILTAAKINGKIIGFGSLWKSFGGVAYSDWTVVDKNYRRIGIGTALWNYKIRLAKKQGVHKVVADSLVINKEGNEFAKSHGLRKIAVMKKHWFGQDYYLWEKILGKSSRVTKNFHWMKIESV